MYQEEENVQARKRQAERAIQLALANRWEDAIAANRSIISLFPNDTDAYNRLGKAFMELGRYPDAKKAYRKALELDATNQIARKNLDRITVLAKSGVAQAEVAQADPTLFIEEMGKSTVTVLEQTAPDATAKLNAGDRLELKAKGSNLLLETLGGDVIGSVEPKLRVRLLKLMEGGNEYAAAITSLGPSEVRVIIKETYQDPSQAGRPSFPTSIAAEGHRPYTKERLLRYETQVEELERAEEEEEEEIAGEAENEWDSETVTQEGHIRLNDVADAEDVEDEIEE